MARMPGATWRPVPNCTKGGQQAVYGVVLHIMEGTLDGSDAWFRNPAAQASSHFGVGKDGRIYQWVDTADRAWAQESGNRAWLSIEHEGNSGDSLTPAQLAATARVVAWAHAVHGVPLQTTDSVTGRGIGWHGMGGAAWGGHPDCPGNPVKAQRAAIITAAKGGTPTVQEDDMDLTPAQLTAIGKEAAHQTAIYQWADPVTGKPAMLGSFIAKASVLEQTVKAQAAAIQALAAKVGSGEDTAAIVAAVEQAIASSVVHVDVDVTGAAVPTS
ncbi:N-acetylmuramoyl-L-alanine amidase [Actinacidiphila sp. ITFR-21]|uniref:N-acetylmuramoyl-L-alanine amidase n=1 Tax=Actinacidiphila sp. ITFR-21 TaxID=3075199 RepID=UPI00288ACA11|nr:peptidoglycan recognition family protein [Streptomyces sp. ITFR-21]WNI15583.1 peptidoglycan recognition family protein [Streptomyces sp. ITFR-21]